MFRSKASVEQRIADAHSRSALKDFSMGMFCMICLVIAVASNMPTQPASKGPQPDSKEEGKDFVDYAVELVEAVL